MSCEIFENNIGGDMDMDIDENDEGDYVYGVSVEEVYGKKYIYYQTYGNGPDGGYMVNADYCDTIYSSHRQWFQPWVLEKQTERYIYKINDDGCEYIKKVSDNYELEDCEYDLFDETLNIIENKFWKELREDILNCDDDEDENEDEEEEDEDDN